MTQSVFANKLLICKILYLLNENVTNQTKGAQLLVIADLISEI